MLSLIKFKKLIYYTNFKGIVTLHKDKPHNFQDGDFIRI